MASVQELHERILKLSTEINLKQEIVQKLERDKSLLQQQLNAILDPVARLPLEISSEIFLQSLPAVPELRGSHAPMLLLNICHTWTNIALSTPALWTAINIIFPCAKGFHKVLPIFLQRAGIHPLSISLRGQYCDRGITSAIWRRSQQLKHLDIWGTCIDLVGRTSLWSLPLLETLTIHVGLGPHTLELIRRAPNLIECIFDKVYHNFDGIETAETLVLPALRRLFFGERDGLPESNDHILNCLSLPGLETLHVSLFRISADDLFSFLKRSSPPLLELVLGCQHEPKISTRLHECFRLVPTLTDLVVWWPEIPFVTKLFAVLAEFESGSPTLPVLHTLIIYIRVHIPDSSWATLLCALSARRTQLKIVEMRLSPGSPTLVRPGADVLAAFKKLVSDGMEIYMGTPDLCNFISV
ncbi:hypothetical protein B0H13DRAFT_2324182 [Mycena leptocephala]|nr:hypothetical protein B0H13DRAFT_2324182 [Mycena leptocephala]